MRSIKRIFMLLCLLLLAPGQLAAQNGHVDDRQDTLTLLNPTEVIGAGDYPATALHDGAQGTVSVLLTADAAGTLRDCRITQSSGVEELDKKTCALMHANGRFRARATPGDGHELYTMHERIKWVIPRDTITTGQAPPLVSSRTLLILTALVPLVTLAGVVLVPPMGDPIAGNRFVVVLVTVFVMIPGMFAMMTVSDRYPSFWPFMTGALLALAFTALAMLLTWLWLRFTNKEMPVDIILRILLCLAVGALYVQPLVLLVNGRVDGAAPRLVPGVVMQTYRTHGKGAANYIVLSGPAAALGNTLRDGEFAVDLDTYQAASLEEHVCVTVHTGLLHLRWWSLAACRAERDVGGGRVVLSKVARQGWC